ncbi:MAG: hypothetical protein HGB14_07205 [Anaerolineaceae bacterium]|nr:hypothetical protein [Anaerolineaceae bacterium]
MMAEKMKKAETDYKTIVSSGVSKDAVPNIGSQQAQTQQQLTEIEKKVTEAQAQMKNLAGFLSNSGGSTNAAMAEVAKILDQHQVRRSKDEKADFPEAQLSPALKEVWQSLKPSESADKKPPDAAAPVATPENSASAMISVHHLWLKGSYNGMYQALTAIAERKLQALPVALTMRMPEVDNNNSGELEWELILWM